MDANNQDRIGKQQTLWLKNKRFLTITIVIILTVIIVFILAVILFGWDWTGFGPYVPPAKDSNFQRGKTLWEWLQLLIVPFMLAIGGFWLNQIQKSREEKTTEQRIKSEREAAEKRVQTERDTISDNQRETAMQTYFDRMSELLLQGQLRSSQQGAEVRKIARIRTLTVLSHLDKARKRTVLQFLQESELIDDRNHFFSFGGAQIDHADLRWLHLEYAHLNGALGGEADFREASLFKASLQGARFDKADFSRANLIQANLSEAHFPEAKFVGADLTGAILNKANLSGANLKDAIVTAEQLAQTTSLKGATMPNGSIHP